MICREVELGLEQPQCLCHAEQRLAVGSLDVRLDVACRRAAEDTVHSGDARRNALAGYRAVSACLVIEQQRVGAAPCAQLPQLGVFHSAAVRAQLGEVLRVWLQRHDLAVAAARVVQKLVDGVAVVGAQIHIQFIAAQL